MSQYKTVLALFAQREDAHQAISRLTGSGVNPASIGYLEALDERDDKNPARGAAEGITIGAASGAVIGGVITAAAVALIPGVGPALVAGALLTVVMGTATGAAGGAVAGSLVGTGLNSDEEPYFMQEVQAGRTLVTVEVENGGSEVAKLLSTRAALEVDSLGTATLYARLRHPLRDGAETSI